MNECYDNFEMNSDSDTLDVEDFSEKELDNFKCTLYLT